MSDELPTVVVGAGVIGIAIARELAMAGKQVIILEQTESFGTQVSSRNSGVIHAGLYYSTNSLKAQLCVRGKQLLYDYCQQRHIQHKRIGKLVVATNQQDMVKLDRLTSQGMVNGVTDLNIIRSEQIKELEPNITAIAALHSPSTGIIDVHDLLVNLLSDVERHDGIIAYHSRVESVEKTKQGFLMHISVKDELSDTYEDYPLECQQLVNAAGLGAQSLARTITDFPQSLIPNQFLAKGNYFALEGKSPFNHLIYPLPNSAGLGAHSLVDFQGRVRFGPDVEWVDHINYDVSEDRKAMFIEQIQRYYPALDPSKLHADFAGIRPKIVGPDTGTTDFMIQSETEHGFAGLVNLFGIESPGLTSSLAIAEYCKNLLLSAN
ncbi:NAD(P)/FAD-dependent oxidoreductase [Thalassotalea sp. HSM 43]|uniref:NAD(P)/FAD-dependent oxidoreductase n=1 Tax=Thalassotalea sp. HSM 43 TaxID=2552945 RepID=UPI00107FED7D|nr:NAD(P)/FAD-dependent oxidoreductase [Thalassotalea sp. HSM 43]QBY06088.1 NAD(P)/FAD-dependent oxidoreductase [Thalassotalea sp. HSM 43]